ncbi:MAG: HigA family addiction module antidote protein [Bacteroidales bacterium]|nr:HigA family addiction module antidote protein [Bacteroidales bacterium]
MIAIKDIDPQMIANNTMPSEPVHPGLLLKEEIEYRGISQKLLAQQMGVSYSVLNEILNGKRPVSIEYALYLEAVLGIDAQLWIQMQADYNLQMAQRDNTIKRRISKIRKMVAAF